MIQLDDERLHRRFWDKVLYLDTGCWIWTGALGRGGYGVYYVDRKARYSHRVAYQHLIGPIAEGLECDHLCRVRLCCNPDHIELVTHAENIRRGDTGKHERDKTHCPHGHEYTAANTYIQHTPRNTTGRACRTCRREQGREWKARQRTTTRENHQ